MTPLRFAQNSAGGHSVANERIMSGFVSDWKSADWVLGGFSDSRKWPFYALKEAWFRCKSGLFPMRLSLVSDASKPNFHAGRCYLPPWQQASDHERAAFCAFFRLEVPVGRVLFSMNYFDKTKPVSATHSSSKAVLCRLEEDKE